MPTEDEKFLYARTQMLHADLYALAKILLANLAEKTGVDYDQICQTWRAESRQRFVNTLAHAETNYFTTLSAAQMLAVAEEIWAAEDRNKQPPTKPSVS